MNPQETTALLQRAEAFWPSLFRGKDEVFTKWHQLLSPLPLAAGANAIETLIETKRVGAPSVAELKEQIPFVQRQIVENNCLECEGTGWIFVSDNKVSDCVCTPRSDEVKRSDRPGQGTVSGKEPATLEEAKKAFDRGLSEIF